VVNKISLYLVSSGGLYIYCLLLEIPCHVGDFGPCGASVEILKVWYVGECCVVMQHDFTWHGCGYSPPSPPPLIESCMRTHAFLPIMRLIFSLISKLNIKNVWLTWGCLIRLNVQFNYQFKTQFLSVDF
jgi:hypothetical protein